MITGSKAGTVEGYGGRRTWRSHLAGLRRLDMPLLLAVVALSVVGALLVRSATFQLLTEQGKDPEGFLKRHILNLVIGFVLGGVVTLLDYRLLRAYVPILYGVACVGLVAVLTPLGDTINGSHSWIVLGGGFQVQPSEFAKVGLVVLLAMILGEPRDGEIGPGRRDVLLALVLAGVPAVLIMLQPDLGTTLVFIAVVLGMLAISGAQKRWLFGLVGGGAAAGAAVWFFGLLKDYQIDRFTAFMNPEADPRGAGYNAQQARIAIGSGGAFGKGLFNGEQTGGHFVPEQQTDFIFTVAGEELGFVGAAVIVALLGVVMWRGLRIATQAADLFGTLVATGAVCWLGFQTFENVGMTIGIMPITGLPLPFVSYGGSATFANMIAFGLLQAVHVRRRPFD
ncbi:rod shape-determining protein RodA [Actinomadura madurae]|uniref:Peptidoglycan glycosyltransferase RodA n=1 Tax=Actinomadura madurae TaxID=1993 RepID=A0A1I5LAZ3_9ACTN|nr:rod shape-determining protein RodA [Actinomadura madurae]MCP9949540.1 rod shape-determining protein RodA [Actinomadura madurae]MCQ0009692.1 rod shape-determining protein RodA [Actinomadura madurae]URM95084.1 rod shape-determining protein RodA [Actinomadura madurae]URN05807.1 rod shape-determining protein RodA [Actinomadura madurae]SFO94450.1 rod shape determining protein RodA [Actinomadura madurae]